MLRSLFEGVQEAWWPLERELALLQALQELYALRDDERYEVFFSIDNVQGVSVPPLLFLPLLENALNHGSGEEAMSFELSALGDVLELSLWNPGEFKGPRQGGTGIETTRRRLALAYGDEASLNVHSKSKQKLRGTQATLRIPARSGVRSKR